MKRKIILIITAFALHFASASGAEISLRKYNELPLGSIKPDGWLREMLVRQRDGITATLDKVYPEVVGDRNGWLGGDGDCWERGPYWIDGLLPMAYILDDAELKTKAQRWVDWTLNSQQESGQFGPCKDYPNEPGLQRGRSQDWWPRMVMLKVLMQYYDATSDERVIPFMDKYFRYQLKTLSEKPLGHWSGWAEYRAADNMIAALWLYRHTGKKYLLDLCDVLHEQGHDFTKMFLESDELSRISTIHCVNLSQGLKEPLVYSQVRNDDRYKRAVDKALEDIRKYHGFPNGMFGGDEQLHGNNPIQGSELCSAVELMYSLEEMSRISGDPAYVELLERIAFNALPAQNTEDFKYHQYFQQANQVSITRGPHNFDIVYDGTASLFGQLCGYPCCLCNLHQGWPKFVQSLWYRTSDGGFAALSYSPCQFTAKVEGIEMTVTEQTHYPMDGKVTINIKLPRRKSVKTAFEFRIPSWTNAAEVKLNGIPIDVTSPMLRIEREWRNGDKVELFFPMHLSTQRWYENAVSIERGPLVYALKIDENWRKVALDPSERKGKDYWEVTPKSPWNYGLLMKDVEKLDFEVKVDESKLAGNWYWSQESAPISIKARASRIPDWTIYNGDTGQMPYSIVRSRIYNPNSSRHPDNIEEITLIPYGATKLRISEFPVLTARRQALRLDVKSEYFGQTLGKDSTFLYTLSNASGAYVTVTNYGCKLVSVHVPDRTGTLQDVIVGYGNIKDLETGAERFAGAVAGRYGNRIYPASFMIGKDSVHLSVNERIGGVPGHIHGGKEGFDRKVWNAEMLRQNAADTAGARVGVRFSYLSPDGEEGYPGNLQAEVIYWFDDSNNLKIEYKATTDKPTVVNMLNHAYFNLKGKSGGYVMDHHLQVFADTYSLNGPSFVPKGDPLPVEGTPFDMREPHRVDYAIDTPSEQIVTMRGFSVCWQLRDYQPGKLSKAAILYQPKNGLGVEVWTTEPGLLTYTGRGFNESIVGKYGPIEKFGGMLLETLHFPNSPHHPEFPTTTLLPGETYWSTTEFRFFAEK